MGVGGGEREGVEKKSRVARCLQAISMESPEIKERDLKEQNLEHQKIKTSNTKRCQRIAMTNWIVWTLAFSTIARTTEKQ